MTIIIISLMYTCNNLVTVKISATLLNNIGCALERKRGRGKKRGREKEGIEKGKRAARQEKAGDSE